MSVYTQFLQEQSGTYVPAGSLRSTSALPWVGSIDPNTVGSAAVNTLWYRTAAAAAAAAVTSGEPTGSDITSYESLAGSTFNARINSLAAGKKMGIGPGTFGWDDFKYAVFGPQSTSASGYNSSAMGAYGVDSEVASSGLEGAGIGQTILQMNPSTMTPVPPTVNASVTNGLSLMNFGKDGVVLRDFTLLGTSQGAAYDVTSLAWKQKCFNGLRLSNVSNGLIERVYLDNAGPGWLNEPSGETFALNDYRGDHNVYNDCEVHGRSQGATGFGVNTSTGPTTYNRCKSHDNPSSAGFAWWESTGITATDCETVNNHTGIVIERCYGDVYLTRMKFSGNASKDIYLGNDNWNGYGGATVHIVDPVLASGQRIVVYYPATEISGTNIQTRADVIVTEGGVNTTSSRVTYSGTPHS